MVHKEQIDGNTTLQAKGATFLPPPPEPSYMQLIQQSCPRVQ